MGQITLPCNILLCTQLLYNLPLTINDISLLVSNDTNCWNLFIEIKSIQIWTPKVHQHLHLHSTCHLNNKTYLLTPDLHWHQYLLVYLVLVTRFTQPLQANVFITLYTGTLHTTTFPVYLCTHLWQLVHCIEALPMLLPQTPHGHLTAFCITFCHSPPWFYSHLLLCLYSPHYPSTH